MSIRRYVTKFYTTVRTTRSRARTRRVARRLSAHQRRAISIRRAFVKSGSRGYTIKGVFGFMRKSPYVR